VEAAVETRTFGISSDEVTAIDRWVEQVGAQWGQSERTVFGARLCIAELAGNVLEHGIARSGGDHIVVTLSRCGDGIGIEFLDSCAAFDPTSEAVAAKKPAPTGAAAEGGRGLMLVRAYADGLTYSNDGIYNRVKLKIRSG
jgi:anti-sigma regulatory factor (Ser/Thr protein kinase)